MQIVNIYGRKNAKFCITKFLIFSFIYLVIQGGGRGVTKMLILAHIGGGGGGGGPEGVKFGSHDI